MARLKQVVEQARVLRGVRGEAEEMVGSLLDILYPEGVADQSPGSCSAPWEGRGETKTRIIYPEGVADQSPGSRSAPWEGDTTPNIYPEGVASRAHLPGDATLSG